MLGLKKNKQTNKQTNIQKKLKLLKILEWLRLHFQKYIFTCLLTCMFQLMALNIKQNIFLCRLHYIDADYVIIMILTVPSEVTVNEKKEKDKKKKEKERRIGTVLEQKGKENIHQRDLQVDQLHLYQSPD